MSSNFRPPRPHPTGAVVPEGFFERVVDFARAYDIDVGDKTMFWMGMVPL